MSLPPSLSVEVIVYRRVDPERLVFAADVAPAAPPPSPEGAWVRETYWAVAVSEDAPLASARRALASRSRYVLPGPPGESFFAFESPHDAEAAIKLLTHLADEPPSPHR